MTWGTEAMPKASCFHVTQVIIIIIICCSACIDPSKCSRKQRCFLEELAATVKIKGICLYSAIRSGRCTVCSGWCFIAGMGLALVVAALQSRVENHLFMHCIVEFFMMNGLGGDVQCINNLNVYPLVNRVDADFSTCLLDELV